MPANKNLHFNFFYGNLIVRGPFHFEFPQNTARCSIWNYSVWQATGQSYIRSFCITAQHSECAVNSSLTVQQSQPAVLSLEWNAKFGSLEFSSIRLRNGFHQSVSLEKFPQETILWNIILSLKSAFSAWGHLQYIANLDTRVSNFLIWGRFKEECELLLHSLQKWIKKLL
jgi:hypothetical protein